MLKASTMAGAGFWVASRPEWVQARSPNEKLNIGGVGVGGQGAWDLGQLGSEYIVAICDVDWGYAAKTFEKYPKARKYTARAGSWVVGRPVPLLVRISSGGGVGSSFEWVKTGSVSIRPTGPGT